MTSKEALTFISKKAIQYIEGSYPVIDNEGLENYEKSQKVLGVLIERDTPMKVIKEVDKKYVDAYAFYDRKTYKCGSCKKVLLVDRYGKLQDNEKTNYCSHCGQKLDW